MLIFATAAYRQRDVLIELLNRNWNIGLISFDHVRFGLVRSRNMSESNSRYNPIHEFYYFRSIDWEPEMIDDPFRYEAFDSVSTKITKGRKTASRTFARTTHLSLRSSAPCKQTIYICICIKKKKKTSFMFKLRVVYVIFPSRSCLTGEWRFKTFLLSRRRLLLRWYMVFSKNGESCDSPRWPDRDLRAHMKRQPHAKK